jgi:hypothetical protein
MEDHMKTYALWAGIGAALGVGVALGMGLKVLATGAAIGIGAGLALGVGSNVVEKRRHAPAGMLPAYDEPALH